jgi:N-acetylglucosamine kinase-like BadF-type ATPase
MDPDEIPPLEIAWNADGETLRRAVRTSVHTDKLAASLALAVEKLAASGLPISNKVLELCRDPDRWDELDQQFHALRAKTLELEKSGKAATVEMSTQLFLENVAKHLWNERTKSTRFNIGSGSWAASALRDILGKLPPTEANEIGDWFVRSLAD